MNRMLNCIQLHWDRKAGMQGVLSDQMRYSIIPAESICGRVHIFSDDASKEILGNAVEEKKKVG